MDKARIQELISKYNAMAADPVELREIELLLEGGEIELHELQELRILDERISELESPGPTLRLDDNFHAMLQREKKPRASASWKSFLSWPSLAPRLAFASVTLLLGFAAGFLLRAPEGNDQKVQLLGQEVSDLKELMMLSLLEKESATERLKAVSLTNDMDQASGKVTDALLQTLNNDENVNVRLAALDALRPYSQDSQVREALIRSISKQQSSLVQISMAELMAALQARSSVNELQKILRDKKTPSDVKRKIQESIKVLS
ncbi:MAG: HEAT repeat domain-containing protein [Chryseolinea sp.]